MRFSRWSFGLLVTGLITGACGDERPPGADDFETTISALTKAQDPSANGDGNFCDDPSALCDEGEGDCDSSAQCSGALLCGFDNGPFFGQPAFNDVCVVAHCANGVRDADETHRDCGGIDCGSSCDAVCGSQPPNGSVGHCTARCVCAAGDGDCNSDLECALGLVCGTDNGLNFGFSANTDVCVTASCNNGVLDAGEEAIDCGGACGTSCTHLCSSDPLGSEDFCTETCPCSALQGDCDTDSECRDSLICVTGAGTQLGFGPDTDACLATTCSSGVQDGDETGIDCGGSCLPCTASFSFIQSEGLTDEDLPYGTAIDSTGAVIIAGKFSGTTNFGGANLSVAGADPTKTDVFIAKYDSAGNHVFSTSFGGTSSDGSRHVDVTTGPNDEIIVVGEFGTTVDFGAGPVTTAGNADIFVVAYDSTGAFLWANTFGGPEDDLGLAVKTQGSGLVLVAGSFEDTCNFDGFSRTSAGGFDAFVAQLFLSTGAVFRVNRYGSTSEDRIYAVDTDASQQVYIGGTFTGTVSFGGIGSVFGETGDAFVARLSPTLRGSGGWIYEFGGFSRDIVYDLETDELGNVVATGIYAQTVDFQTGTGTTASQGGYDGFLLSLDTGTGAPNWVTTFGGTNNDIARSVGVIPSTGRVGVVGYVPSAPVLFPASLTYGGANDAFLLIYDQAGTFQEAYLDGGTGNDRFRAIDGGSQGYSIGGEFSGAATSILGQPLSSSGGRDAVIMRVNP